MVKVLVNVTDKTHVKRLSKIRMIPFKISLPNAAKNGPPLAKGQPFNSVDGFLPVAKN